MYPITPNPRGMALVMAMAVVVLVTLLVAGAISFTGTELASSGVQTQEDMMSSCVQAARNLFLSKLNLLDVEGAKKIVIDEDLRGTKLRTGHLHRLAEISATDVSSLMQDPSRDVQDISNGDSHKPKSRFYTVTATCRESDEPSSPEREVEFMVRVGL